MINDSQSVVGIELDKAFNDDLNAKGEGSETDTVAGGELMSSLEWQRTTGSLRTIIKMLI